ncbi:hypothetical protein B0H19DRAFT_1331532 [Mycena capillaripes]|nr:hypothetical protein B0H19DRAFT_1331532 [Mycena capillaripes]
MYRSYPSANGYLVDQFLQDMSNKRTDEYSTVGLAPDAVVAAVGTECPAVRCSPWSPYQGHALPPCLLLHHLPTRFTRPPLAWLHLIESRISGDVTRDETPESNDTLRKVWAGRPLVNAGGGDT